MTIEDIISPEELEQFFLEERKNLSIVPEQLGQLLPDEYIMLFDKYIQNEDMCVGMYRALTYVIANLNKKAVV